MTSSGTALPSRSLGSMVPPPPTPRHAPALLALSSPPCSAPLHREPLRLRHAPALGIARSRQWVRPTSFFWLAPPLQSLMHWPLAINRRSFPGILHHCSTLLLLHPCCLKAKASITSACLHGFHPRVNQKGSVIRVPVGSPFTTLKFGNISCHSGGELGT
jgi:hypothetical protein